MFFFLQNKQIQLALAGLFSMLLLTLGPLVGQLTMPNIVIMPVSALPMMQMSGTSMSDHAAHDHSKMRVVQVEAKSDHSGHSGHSDHHGHSQSQVNSAQDSHENAFMAWHEACGYCAFFEHFPFLSISVPSLESSLPRLLALPIEFVRSAFNSASLYLHALKRAPPSLFV